jgi:hypothetical protein
MLLSDKHFVASLERVPARKPGTNHNFFLNQNGSSKKRNLESCALVPSCRVVPRLAISVEYARNQQQPQQARNAPPA